MLLCFGFCSFGFEIIPHPGCYITSIVAKNQASAKQHPKAELLLFKNYSHSSSTLSSRNNRTYSKKKQNNKYICIHEMI